MTVRKTVAIPGNPNLGTDVTILVIIAFAYTLEDATLSTRDSNHQHIKYISQVSRTVSFLKSKDGVLRSYSNKNDETEDAIVDFSLKQTLTSNHDL